MRGVLLLSGLLALGAAQADEAALQRCRALADGQLRLACYDAIPAPLRAPVPQPAPPAPPPQAAAPGFGLEASAAVQQAITSTIPGVFEGWAPRQRIRLANGQVWQVADDSTGVYDLRDAKVTIERSRLGGFVMEIEGAKRTLRVRRVE